MASGQRDRAKERYWRGYVAAWRRSGLSVRDYCRSYGLSEPSFYGWRRVLTERERLRRVQRAGAGDHEAQQPAAAGERRSSRDTAAAVPLSPFVPLRLVDTPAPTAAVEVVLRGGRVVRVADGFAAPTLRAVVAVLEELPC
jgi:hypothetical protein